MTSYAHAQTTFEEHRRARLARHRIHLALETFWDRYITELLFDHWMARLERGGKL